MNGTPVPEGSQAYFRPREAAKYLDLSIRTLARWRDEGVGPRFSRTPGGKIRYAKRWLDAYMESRAVRTRES